MGTSGCLGLEVNHLDGSAGVPLFSTTWTPAAETSAIQDAWRDCGVALESRHIESKKDSQFVLCLAFPAFWVRPQCSCPKTAVEGGHPLLGPPIHWSALRSRQSTRRDLERNEGGRYTWHREDRPVCPYGRRACRLDPLQVSCLAVAPNAHLISLGFHGDDKKRACALVQLLEEIPLHARISGEPDFDDEDVALHGSRQARSLASFTAACVSSLPHTNPSTVWCLAPLIFVQLASGFLV